MDLKELKEKRSKFDLSEINTTTHAFRRIQDKRRQIKYNKITDLILSQKGLYKCQKQKAKFPGEIKFKLRFKINFIYDMNIYIVFNREEKEKGLNRLNIISAHKVKRKIQEKIEYESKR